MQLTIVVDNATFIDSYYLAEPGLSIHLEAEGRSVLFDAGYSDVTVRNAAKLGIDLAGLDHIALSHSHLDHVWGLVPVFALHTEAALEGRPLKRPELIAHPEVFDSRFAGPCPEIGSLINAEGAGRFCDVRLSRDPVWITDRLVFLGEIPRELDFEKQAPVGERRTPSGSQPCFVPEDSALAWKGEAGLVVVTGCSHAGICNIIRHAQRVCGDQRVQDVTGGLHLLDPPCEQMAGTLEFMRRLGPGRMHPCHCTDLPSKLELARVAEVREAGVGLRLAYD